MPRRMSPGNRVSNKKLGENVTLLRHSPWALRHFVQLVTGSAGRLKGRLVRGVCPSAIDCNSGVGGAGPVPVSRNGAEAARRRRTVCTETARRRHRDGTEMAQTRHGDLKKDGTRVVKGKGEEMVRR